MLTEPLRTHIRSSFFSSPSDLMNSTVVKESLSTTTTKVCSREESTCYLTTTRFFTTETSCSSVHTLRTTCKTSKPEKHLQSYKPLILRATQLLRREPTFDGMSAINRYTKGSLLPCLGDALSWLTATATIKDVRSIKNRVNQLITMQHQQQETLVHTISLLNVTRHATQVKRQHINMIMDAVERTHQGITMLYNITSSLYTYLKYQQILLHTHSILANLGNLLYYIRQVAMHVMDYKDAATTGIPSPHILSVEDLQKMLTHIEEVLPSTMYLPISSDDTPLFANTHAPMF